MAAVCEATALSCSFYCYFVYEVRRLYKLEQSEVRLGHSVSYLLWACSSMYLVGCAEYTFLLRLQPPFWVCVGCTVIVYFWAWLVKCDAKWAEARRAEISVSWAGWRLRGLERV